MSRIEFLEIKAWLLSMLSIVTTASALYFYFIPHPLSGTRQRIEYIDSRGRLIAEEAVSDDWVRHEDQSKIKIADSEYTIYYVGTVDDVDVYRLKSKE